MTSSSGLRAAYHSRAKSANAASSMKGASRAIAKECERLLCGDMRRIFLGVGNDPSSVARSMGSIESSGSSGDNGRKQQRQRDDRDEHNKDVNGRDMRFVEVWDYVGGTSFRGFIAERDRPRGNVERSLFLFFENVAGTQLKTGLMALIELASECFSCDRLVLCLERNGGRLESLMRDLGWVGFELMTLAPWLQEPTQAINARKASFSSTMSSGSESACSVSSSVFSDDEVTSEKWLFMGMDV